MKQAVINVGPLDARARIITGSLAILGGLTALNGFFQALGFLTWIVCAAMMYFGVIFAMGGFKDGTAAFGFPLLILSVLDAWLPLVHKGYWGLIAGVFVAAGAFQTARTRVCPINSLLGVNTAKAGS
ncbi:MAG TPA: YgaP-like transmembrane domain [Gemmatimonadales bacterium]|nr:YgaP-like transmembrane domain [Gemmatimonadales bacterium]